MANVIKRANDAWCDYLAGMVDRYSLSPGERYVDPQDPEMEREPAGWSLAHHLCMLGIPVPVVGADREYAIELLAQIPTWLLRAARFWYHLSQNAHVSLSRISAMHSMAAQSPAAAGLSCEPRTPLGETRLDVENRMISSTPTHDRYMASLIVAAIARATEPRRG